MSTPAHVWFECHPDLLVHPGVAGSALTVNEVWSRMSDADRHRFHRFTCEGDRSDRTVDVIYEMWAALRREGVA